VLSANGVLEDGETYTISFAVDIMTQNNFNFASNEDCYTFNVQFYSENSKNICLSDKDLVPSPSKVLQISESTDENVINELNLPISQFRTSNR
jgi:hypothetical protein